MPLRRVCRTVKGRRVCWYEEASEEDDDDEDVDFDDELIGFGHRKAETVSQAGSLSPEDLDNLIMVSEQRVGYPEDEEHLRRAASKLHVPDSVVIGTIASFGASIVASSILKHYQAGRPTGAGRGGFHFNAQRWIHGLMTGGFQGF